MNATNRAVERLHGARLALLAAVMALALLVLAAGAASVGARQATPGAGAGPCPDGTPTASPAASAQATPAATPEAGACVTVEMVDIDFNPNEFTIPANTPVELVFPNKGSILHNFSLDEKNNPELPIEPIDVDVEPGEQKSVVVNLPPGDYYYYCDIAGHEAAGMFGTIHVEEQ